MTLGGPQVVAPLEVQSFVVDEHEAKAGNDGAATTAQAGSASGDSDADGAAGGWGLDPEPSHFAAPHGHLCVSVLDVCLGLLPRAAPNWRRFSACVHVGVAVLPLPWRTCCDAGVSVAHLLAARLVPASQPVVHAPHALCAGGGGAAVCHVLVAWRLPGSSKCLPDCARWVKTRLLSFCNVATR